MTLTLALWLPNLCYSRLCSLRDTEQGTPLGDHSPLGAPGTPQASPTMAAASTSKEKEEPRETRCLHLQLRKPWTPPARVSPISSICIHWGVEPRMTKQVWNHPCERLWQARRAQARSPGAPYRHLPAMPWNIWLIFMQPLNLLDIHSTQMNY